MKIWAFSEVEHQSWLIIFSCWYWQFWTTFGNCRNYQLKPHSHEHSTLHAPWFVHEAAVSRTSHPCSSRSFWNIRNTAKHCGPRIFVCKDLLSWTMPVAYHSGSRRTFKVIILLPPTVIICAMEALEDNIYIITVARDWSLPVPQASWSSVLLKCWFALRWEGQEPATFPYGKCRCADRERGDSLELGRVFLFLPPASGAQAKAHTSVNLTAEQQVQ